MPSTVARLCCAPSVNEAELPEFKVKGKLGRESCHYRKEVEETQIRSRRFEGAHCLCQVACDTWAKTVHEDEVVTSRLACVKPSLGGT